MESGRGRNGSGARASALREEIRALSADDRRLTKRIDAMQERVLDEDELAGAFEAFDPMWDALSLEGPCPKDAGLFVYRDGSGSGRLGASRAGWFVLGFGIGESVPIGTR